MMNLSCFSSSDPAAVNANLVYDEDTESGDLWSRSSQDVPLPLCSSSSPPPDSRCLVCWDQIVFAVCRSLTDGVKIIMEAVGAQVKISKSGCPKLPSDDAHAVQLHSLIAAAITSVLLLLIIIGVGCGYKRWRRSKTEKECGEVQHAVKPASLNCGSALDAGGGDDITKADN
ncbi:uncharacterized protein LOC122877909 isoform X2 [Siniperca chuatsi]|uniref:uncharacterized protein LOC122877909 isoform X2 n=1 Tax=Siniperca chuatsi TaxID=119488 RepID=UPI001CE0B8B6|nr:uncharacterized protein LOC122877909 isoform X2 [Siniperca chuatsi]